MELQGTFRKHGTGAAFQIPKKDALKYEEFQGEIIISKPDLEKKLGSFKIYKEFAMIFTRKANLKKLKEGKKYTIYFEKV
jgi:hypothetical protein